MYDVLIIGGGVVGCSIARELSRLNLKIALLEKEPDVGWGASCRNSGVVHAGYNNKPGTLMARFCVEGNQGFQKLCADLDVPYHKIGKLVVADNPEEMQALERLKAQGESNGVEGLEIIDSNRVRELEPHLENAYAAMLSPNSAITSPYHLTIALAENALENGATILLSQTVDKITKIENEHGESIFVVGAGNQEYRCRVLINSAGVKSAEISKLADVNDYCIYPCRGEYYVLDKYAGSLINHLVYPVPKPGVGGLGIHLTPTVEGNILIGPSNEYTDQDEDYSVTAPVLKTLSKEARDYMPQMNGSYYIRTYAGMRAKQAPPEVGGFYDYVIQEEKNRQGLINLIGIESPGLTASQPIARYVRDITEGILQRLGITVEERKDFNPVRTGPVRFVEQDERRRQALIAEHPDYGEVICRCETVTKKEIREAIENPLGARSLISIKYRSRAMMGRCQGGYCMQRILQILTEEYGYRPEEVLLGGPESQMLTGKRSDVR